MSDTRFISSLGACILALSLTLAACGGGGGSSDTGSGSDGGSNGGGGNTGGGTGQVEKPAISAQPANQSVVAGQVATFTVTATGGAPLAYQWKKNGADISGANSSTYTTPATSDADIGAVLAYSVAVSNTAGTVSSTEATLAVTAAAVAPTLTTQPADLTVVEGKTATFSVEVTGTSPLRYQWKKNGTDIPDATTSSYTTPATSLADSGTGYSVEVSNDVGTATSSVAMLTVTTVPAITTQPVAQTVIAGQTASFSVQATGTAPLRYQWKKGGTNIDGAAASSYTTPATSLADSGTVYSVEVSNGVGTATSNDASLTVTVAPVITTQPAAQSVLTGQAASFSVTATGTETLTYQWWRGNTMIDGATTSTYRIAATASGDNGAVFKVVVKNSAGEATSTTATLTVAPVLITTQPMAKAVAPGNTASFSVTATGTGTLTYQWKKDGVNVTAGVGGTTSAYTTPVTAIADSGAVFTVVVTNSLGGTTTSNPATLTVAKYSLVANASGGTYDKTECVKDNGTGLIWEGKTASGSRLGTTQYYNFDTIGSTQTFYAPITQADLDASTNSIGYRNSVNAGSGLCGITVWRVPTKDELLTLLDTSQLTALKINTDFFPNTSINANYWTSTADSAPGPTFAWAMDFYDGGTGINHGWASRSSTLTLRLVSGTSQ